MQLVPFGLITYLRLFSPNFLLPLYHNTFVILFMTVILCGFFGLDLVAKHIMKLEFV